MASSQAALSQLQDMAGELLVMLSAHEGGEKGGRDAWDKLQGTLAKVATYVATQGITVDDLHGVLEDATNPSSLHLGDPEAQALLGRILASLEEEIRALDARMAIPRFREILLVVARKMDMVPLRDSTPVHMVDGDSNFCEANVTAMVRGSPKLSSPDASYTVVSIVGAQSSGKSYLLNRLFATMFPEMDAKRGRSQTTRGIMISRCIGPSLLVLDVEGFDGREKGQDTLFEKQAALFALTISDIMLVNMNVADVGREQAGGTQLFKTIFKERIKLPHGFTKILVVLRMYDGETPLEMLRDDVMESMIEMWKSVNVESLRFQDYIEVNVVGLPDKKSPDFPKEVTALRKLLSDTNLDHNSSAKVPASGFSASSGMFWDKIKKNKKLDIPSHQVAVARLFCGQTTNDALNYVYSSEDYKLLKAEESPCRFKEISDKLLESIITMYDHETEMYDPTERDNGRQNMVEKLNKVIKENSRELIGKMRRKTTEQFKGEYAEHLKNMEVSDADLNYDDQMVDSCVEKFMNSCQELKVFDSNYVHSSCEGLQKVLHQNLLYQILTKKEMHWRKAVELAHERSDKNMEEVLNKLEDTVKRRKHAGEEMKGEREKSLKEELEYMRRKIGKLVLKQEKIDKIMESTKPKKRCTQM